MNTWTIKNAWAAAVAGNDRQIAPRDYLYASELGGSDIDIILKLKGVQPTNPPNNRSKGKFFAGHVFEDALYLALLRCGVVLDSQKRCEFQYDNLMRVSGKCDFIAGGEINVEKSEAEIKAMKLSEHMESLSLIVLHSLASEYGSMTLKPLVVENKSVSKTMFDKHEKNDSPAFNHQMQTFHYLKSLNMNEGRIFYINKDDCRVLEFAVYNPMGVSDIEKAYKAEIERLTNYYTNNIMPEKEPEVIFDGRFSKNWKVEYSNYLTMLYGYERPDIYADKWKSVCARWNYTLSRVVKNAKLTDTNKKTINEIEKYFDFEAIAESAKKSKELLALSDS